MENNTLSELIEMLEDQLNNERCYPTPRQFIIDELLDKLNHLYLLRQQIYNKNVSRETTD